jgi:NAD(P)-dependent dehydrogenase (short-subunit alcohol dehydrogenase family)
MTKSYLESLFGLSDQVAVVIGGTGVLGGALAEGIAQAGATTVVAGRSPERGQQRVDAITKLGAKASFLPVDVYKRESIEKLLADTLKEHGRVDMLVNCAGVNAANDYFTASDDEWQRIIQTNLTSTHWACQIFGAQMVKAGGGSILNIGSVSGGHTPLSRVYAYAASKAAVLNLSKNVARELAIQKVRVNVLCPGFFPAEQNRKILDPKRIENIMRHTPMDRFGEPNELIGAALLLLSKNAGSFITGSAVYVDGGFTAMSI